MRFDATYLIRHHEFLSWLHSEIFLNVKGKPFYKVRIDNASPLILNGLAILGEGKTRVETTPKVLSGISISPRKSMTVPVPGEIVDNYGLRKGVHVIAADLSGL